jgi:hypothetical protein
MPCLVTSCAVRVEPGLCTLALPSASRINVSSKCVVSRRDSTCGVAWVGPRRCSSVRQLSRAGSDDRGWRGEISVRNRKIDRVV